MKAVLASLCLGAIALAACNSNSPQTAAKQQAQPQQTAAPGATAVVDPAAMQALERMGAYLRTLERFELSATTVADEVMDDGQKLQFAGAVTYRVQRPNAFFIETRTDRKQRQFYYNGQTLTIFAPRRGFYTQVAAPATIREVIEQAQSRYNVELPLIDLFYWGTPEANTASIRSASVIGFARINGADTDQYAFRQDGVDWQIWIERGDRPLPRKIVITTRDGDEEPQYAAELTWNTAPHFAQTAFTFVAPRDAHAIRISDNGA